MITLYSYFRSSTAYRVRIALHLKGLDFQTIPVNLLKGEQTEDQYRSVNPMMAVPTLIHNDFVLGESLAIMEYLDQVKSDPLMVFGNAAEQAYIRQVSQIIAMNIHPLTNLRVTKYLQNDLGLDDAAKNKWYEHWAVSGLTAVESVLRERGWSGNCALGDVPSMADACIVAQMYGMRRFKISLEHYPICRKIEAHCARLPAFQRAAPESQPDAPPDLEMIHGPGFKGGF